MRVSILPLAVVFLSSSSLARTLQVGPGRPLETPSAAAAVALDGDVVEIDAGSYAGDVATWPQNDLVLRGVGGKARLDASGKNAGGKGIWVLQGDRTTVESIEFSGATVPDHNGAGIRQEGASLTVRDCSFHDNENGILAGDNATSDIVIESTEFAHNGYGDGYTHNFYINHVRSFTLRACYSHDAKIGHLFKSRALTNYVLYNRLTDEGGTASYELDLPNGGVAYVIGNLIEQSDSTDNPALLSFGEEGLTNPGSQLYVVNNTFINSHPAGASFVVVAAGATAQLVNNLFVGVGTALSGPGTQDHNLPSNSAGFVDQSSLDCRLTPSSPAVDQGVTPDSTGGFSLVPTLQYSHPRKLLARSTAGKAIDVGAYELGGESPLPAGGSGAGGKPGIPGSGASASGGRAGAGTAGANASSAGSGDSGACGCRAGGAARQQAPLLVLVGLAWLACCRRRGSVG